MEKFSIKDYIEKRLIIQRKWYENKATFSKKRFMNYQKIIIVLGAIIPIIVVINSAFDLDFLGEADWSGFLSAIISAIIAIIAGFDKLQQPQTSWYNYRAAEEILKKEEWLFKYKAGPYSELDEDIAEKLLVERIESAISADMARFTQSKKDEKKKEDDIKLPVVDEITDDKNNEKTDSDNEEVYG